MKKLAVLTLAVLFSLIATAGEPMATMKYVTNQVNRLDGRIDAAPDFTDVTNIAIETAKEEIEVLGLADTNFVKSVISDKRDKSDMKVYVSGVSFNISKIESDYPVDSPFACYPAKVSETPSSYVWLLVDKNGNVKKSSEAYDTQTALMTAKTARFNYGTNTYTVAATDRFADYPFIYTGNGSGITEFARVPFGNLATKATTLEGYGITNAVTKAELSAKASKVANGTYVPSIAFIPLYDGPSEDSQLIERCWLTNVVLNTANGYPQSATVHLSGTYCGRTFDDDEYNLVATPVGDSASIVIDDDQGEHNLYLFMYSPSDPIVQKERGFFVVQNRSTYEAKYMYLFTEHRVFSPLVEEVDTIPMRNHKNSLITSKAVYEATSGKLDKTGGTMTGDIKFSGTENIGGWTRPASMRNLYGGRYIATGDVSVTNNGALIAYGGALVAADEALLDSTTVKYPQALRFSKTEKSGGNIIGEYTRYTINGIEQETYSIVNRQVTTNSSTLMIPKDTNGKMLGGTLARTEDIATAITNKADKTALADHVNNKDNPHSVTAKQIGAYSIKQVDEAISKCRDKLDLDVYEYGNASVRFPDGFRAVDDWEEYRYDAPPGGETITFLGPVPSSSPKTPTFKYYYPSDLGSLESFAPEYYSVWCLVCENDGTIPQYMMYSRNLLYFIGRFDSETPTLMLGRGSATVDAPTMTRPIIKTDMLAKVSHVVRLVKDSDGKNTAVTIGSRKSGEPVGKYSLAHGVEVTASAIYSHAEGYNTTSTNEYSHAEGFWTTASGGGSHAEGYKTIAGGESSHTAGYKAKTNDEDEYAFAWNGDGPRDDYYTSHGPGTYNINPVGGLKGFWIGEKTLLQHIADVAPEPGNYAAVSNAAMKALANTETLSMESNEVEIVNESIPFCREAVNFTYTSGTFTVNPTNWPNYKSTFIFGTVADGIPFASNIMFSGFVNSNETVVPASATTIPRGSKWYGNIRRIGSNYYVEYIGACE